MIEKEMFDMAGVDPIQDHGALLRLTAKGPMGPSSTVVSVGSISFCRFGCQVVIITATPGVLESSGGDALFRVIRFTEKSRWMVEFENHAGKCSVTLEMRPKPHER